jgi:hypothetical protein
MFSDWKEGRTRSGNESEPLGMGSWELKSAPLVDRKRLRMTLVCSYTLLI